MALLHQATLTPTKLALAAGWAKSQDWFEGSGDPVLVGAYRFDDPDGEVGVETLLIRAGGGPVLQVPVTYRDAPLDGAKDWLIGTTEHSVLGTRWVYDAAGDSVYVAALATAALTSGVQAEMWIEIDGAMTQREPTALAAGNGTSDEPILASNVGRIANEHKSGVTVIETPTLAIVLVRVLVPDAAIDPSTEVGSEDAALLTGTWNGQPIPSTFASVAVIAAP